MGEDVGQKGVGDWKYVRHVSLQDVNNNEEPIKMQQVRAIDINAWKLSSRCIARAQPVTLGHVPPNLAAGPNSQGHHVACGIARHSLAAQAAAVHRLSDVQAGAGVDARGRGGLEVVGVGGEGAGGEVLSGAATWAAMLVLL